MYIKCFCCKRIESKPPYGASFDTGTVDGFCSTCIPAVLPMAKNVGVVNPQTCHHSVCGLQGSPCDPFKVS